MACKTEDIACPLCNSFASIPAAKGIDFEYATVDEEFTFCRCLDCSLLYLSPRPTETMLDTIYPESYAPYHFSDPGQSFTLKVREYLERRMVLKYVKTLPEDAVILDAGCGTPSFLQKLQKNGLTGWQLYGNDISPETIACLEACGFHALPGRFEKLSACGKKFDIIFFRQVIEHLDNPFAVLMNATKLLKPNGKIVIETPNEDAWDAYLFRKRYWGGYHFPRHWTIFSLKTLQRIGNKAGLKIYKTEYKLSPTFWIQSLHHALQEHGWKRLGTKIFSHKNIFSMCMASLIDVLQLAVSGRTSNIHVEFMNNEIPK